MLNSVSFAARKDLYERPNMDAPQAHQRGPILNHPPKEAPKSSNKAAKTIAKLIATAAVVLGAVAFSSKKGWLKPDKIKNIIPEKLLNWEKVASYKEPVKKGLAAVEKFGNNIADKTTGVYNTVGNFFKNLMPKKSA